MNAKDIRKEIENIIGKSFDSTCIIFDSFINANDKHYHQLEYCLKNCRLACLFGKKRQKHRSIEP